MLSGVSIAAMLLWGAALALAGGAVAKCALDAKERIAAARTPGDEALADMPLAMRLLLPFVQDANAAGWQPALRQDAAGWQPALRQDAARDAAVAAQLTAAGMDEALTPTAFARMRMVFPLVWSVAWILPCKVLGDLCGFEASSTLSLWGAGAVYFMLFPGLWLRGLVKRRHFAIVKSLPFVLDVLTLSVEAGLDFMGALQRYCEGQSRKARKGGVLEHELGRMLREIQVGYPRRVALANLAARAGEPNLRSVVHALVQADELGVSVGTVLRVESDQLRAKRFDRAEKLANEAPVKMLGPLLLCIFPAVFVILLGPMAPQIVKFL